MPWLDGAASIGIGVVLAATAALLAYETKGLLIGEAAVPEVAEAVRAIVDKTPAIRAINELRTLHFGPEDILLALSLDFIDQMPASAVEETITEMEKDIKAAFPAVRRLFIEVQSTKSHQESLERYRSAPNIAKNGPDGH
jgi:divalent metal cation (Fe/Co/Zn/Cd) transporter